MTANKIDIAQQLCLRAKDIMTLTGYGQTTAYKIMAVCRERFGGAIPLRPDAVKAESFYRYFGTTQADYVKSLKGEQQ